VTIRDTSRLGLHPLRIAALGDGHYSILRKGGRKEVATRALGVQALARFEAGDSLGEVQAWLAQKYDADPQKVNLTPLLRSLLNAGMIASVDEVVLETDPVRLRDYLQFQWRFEVLPRLTRSVKQLPLAAARPLLQQLVRTKLKDPCREKVRRAGGNFSLVLRAGEEARRRFEEEYFNHLVGNVVDLEALRGRSLAEVDPWIESFVQIENVESFEWARRQGRGVMLVGFHFTSCRLLPVALMRQGISLMSMGAINIGWGARETKEWIDAWRKVRPSYGSLELVDNLDLPSVNKLIAGLRGGGTVLTLPDVYALSTFDDEGLAERARFFGMVRSNFPRATCPVRFFDHWIDVNPWGGWLAATARPVVLPVLVNRRSRKLVCRFGEPIEGDSPQDAKGKARAINERLFAQLEEEVGKHPSQWFGWHNLNKLNPRRINE
jgi:lauroyl/myristoyl acyltransferase